MMMYTSHSSRKSAARSSHRRHASPIPSNGRVIAPQQVIEREGRHPQRYGKLLRVAAGDGEPLGLFIERARQVDCYPAAECVGDRVAIDRHVENAFILGNSATAARTESAVAAMSTYTDTNASIHTDDLDYDASRAATER